MHHRRNTPDGEPGRDPLEERDPHAVPPATWRTEIMASGALNVLLGAWLMASPIVLGYGAGDPAWHDAAVGLVIVVFAVAHIVARRAQSWLGWLNTLLGVWLLAGAFWRADSAAAAWNDAIVGLLVVALGSIAAAATEQARRRARRQSARPLSSP